jgi:gamma-glutamylputrescine oxidase
MAQGIYKDLTWYDSNTIRRTTDETLRGTVKTGVCVIGGGFAGLTCALELGRRGVSTVLLEAKRIGAGASGRNAGIVHNGFAAGVTDLTRQVGQQSAKTFYEMSRLGSEYVRNEISSYDPSIKIGEGFHLVSRNKNLEAFHRLRGQLGDVFNEPIGYLDRSEVGQELGTARYHGSIFFEDAFHIHPLKYAVLLQKNCELLGVKVYENSRALVVQRLGAGYSVSVDDGEVLCEHVIFCVSADDRHIHQPSGRAVLPVVAYLSVTEPLDEDIVGTDAAVADTRRAGDYFRRVDEGRLMWGGGITTRLSRPTQLAGKLRRDILSVYPKLQFPRIDYAWSGQMAYAINKMPLIGRDQEGYWFATGFGGHGINTTAMAGQLLARAIADDDDRYRQFSQFSPKWAYGQLGRLGMLGAYWWMRAKDRWDEARRF